MIQWSDINNKTPLKDLLSQPLTASQEQKAMTDWLCIPTYLAKILEWSSSSMSVGQVKTRKKWMKEETEKRVSERKRVTPL